MALGWVQVLQREKIKVEYRTLHLSKIVGMLSPPIDFSLAVPSPPCLKINKIEYQILCCANAQHLVSRTSILFCPWLPSRLPSAAFVDLSLKPMPSVSLCHPPPTADCHCPPLPTTGRAFHEVAAIAGTAVATTSATTKITMATAVTRGRQA
jgi:hypothetical protein